MIQKCYFIKSRSIRLDLLFIQMWSPILHLLFKAFCRSQAGLNTIFWNISSSSTISLLWNICEVILLDQEPRYKVTVSKHSVKLALEVNADLLEWAFKVPLPTPDFIRIVVSLPDIVLETISLWRWIKRNKSWKCFSPNPHFSFREIYSSRDLTTRLSCCAYSS